MNEQQPPKEYQCSWCQRNKFNGDESCPLDLEGTNGNSDIFDGANRVIKSCGCGSFIDTRSRPHPAPAFKRCCDSCINVPCKVLNRVPCLAQEKQENICEENGCTDIENCDEICQHSRLFSSLQMQEAKAEAARKAREDFAEALIDFIDANNVIVPDEKSEESDDMLFTGEIREKIESLRHSTQEARR